MGVSTASLLIAGSMEEVPRWVNFRRRFTRPKYHLYIELGIYTNRCGAAVVSIFYDAHIAGRLSNPALTTLLPHMANNVRGIIVTAFSERHDEV